MTTRREFLKSCAAAGVFVPAAGISKLALSTMAEQMPFTLFVFQRGGCDGLNLVGPSNDRNYIDARAPGLRILDSGGRAGLSLANGLSAELDFRLHPDAKPLHELYEGHELAVVHACGLKDGTRSHFEAQDLVEKGETGTKAQIGAPTGWLTRYLSTLGTDQSGKALAVSATAGIPISLASFENALAIPDLDNGLSLPGGKEASRVLEQLYLSGESDVHRAGTRTLALTQLVDTHLPRQPDGRLVPYAAGGPPYERNGFATGLKAIARLIRMDIGLKVACIDHRDWDTHNAQEGRFAQLVTELSRDLSAFYKDMASIGKPFRIVVMTEFGRRLRSNRSTGTDHGHGTTMLVMGDSVIGGRMFGNWPGLDTEHLDRGLDLAVTTDYRQVLADTLSIDSHQKANVFPGLNDGQHLGLLREARA
jgi:uncharacterized protein (DUF1501 family)